jgi:selenocysteine lyase/cysteine desulfurase
MHGALGTLARGGAVRLSWGAFNTPADIDAALDALRAIAAG